MEKELEDLPRYTINELIEGDEDLQMLMTIGLVVGGTYLDLLSLKKWLENKPQYKLVYKMISTAHLRVVKVREYEEFLEWKRKRS